MVPKQGVCFEIHPSDQIQRWQLTWLAISTISMFSVFLMHGGGTGIGSRFSSRIGMSLLPSSITGINSQGGSSIQSTISTSIPPNPSQLSPRKKTPQNFPHSSRPSLLGSQFDPQVSQCCLISKTPDQLVVRATLLFSSQRAMSVCVHYPIPVGHCQ